MRATRTSQPGGTEPSGHPPITPAAAASAGKDVLPPPPCPALQPLGQSLQMLLSTCAVRSCLDLGTDTYCTDLVGAGAAAAAAARRCSASTDASSAPWRRRAHAPMRPGPCVHTRKLTLELTLELILELILSCQVHHGCALPGRHGLGPGSWSPAQDGEVVAALWLPAVDDVLNQRHALVDLVQRRAPGRSCSHAVNTPCLTEAEMKACRTSNTQLLSAWATGKHAVEVSTA